MRSKKALLILFALLIIALIIGAFHYSKKGSLFGANRDSGNDTQELSPLAGRENEYLEQGSRPGFKLYKNSNLNISFEYDEELKISSFEESDIGDVVEIHNPANPDDKRGLELFASAFDEDMEIVTPERIWQDLPDLVINNPQEAIIAGGKQVLIFEGEDEIIGATREVWIIHNQHLFQIVASMEADQWLAEVMKTWKF